MDLRNNDIHSKEAFAPATCGNVAVGFDILGFAINEVGDIVKLTKRSDQKIIIKNIDSKDALPFDVNKNVCSAVIINVIKEFDLKIGFDIDIKKGIPLSSGMGGSAASSVAAILAFNAFLKKPLSKNELIKFALFGEYIASGESHADNVAPCLYGGLTLVRSEDPITVIQLPVPEGIYSVIVHPQMRIDTESARRLIKRELPLKDFVRQSANLGSFIVSLYENDLELMKKSLNDVLIEPQRKVLIPGFEKIKKRILEIGALGMSLSGSGPSVFALSNSLKTADMIKKEMMTIFETEGLESEGWISAVGKMKI